MVQNRWSGSGMDHFTQAGQSGFQFPDGQGDGMHVGLG